jgi:ribosome maturation factor RimP
MKTLSDRTTEEIRAIAGESGCRLLAVESSGAGRGAVLRLVLEREDGRAVGVNDCEAVSREVSAVLDAADEIPYRYTLEVTSAGLERKLYDPQDAARFVGRRIRLQTTEAILPSSAEPGARSVPQPARNIRGRLASVEGDALRVVDEENRKTYNVRFGDIRLARLEFEWPERGDRRMGPR